MEVMQRGFLQIDLLVIFGIFNLVFLSTIWPSLMILTVMLVIDVSQDIQIYQDQGHRRF